MLGTVLGTCMGIILLLNIPYIQQQTAVLISKELSNLLDRDVQIGRVNVGLLNRIIIDDLILKDPSSKEILKVTRLSAKVDILPLLKGRISIGTVQIFGFNVQIERKSPQQPSNFQFLIDALTSPKDTASHNDHLNLRINSILIRRGKVSYHVLSERQTPGKFDSNHIELQNIIANISLKALHNDSINAFIKRLSIEEKNSRFALKKLSMKLIGNNKHIDISNFSVELPRSLLQTDTIQIKGDKLFSFNNFSDNAHFIFHLKPSYITLKDIAAFVPAFSTFKDRLYLEIKANGKINHIQCPYVLISAGDSFRLYGNCSLQNLTHPNAAYISGRLSRLYATSEGIAFFMRNLDHVSTPPSPIIQRLGNIAFQGQISGYLTELATYGMLQTQLGNIQVNLKIGKSASNNLLTYSGSIKTDNFELGQILGNNKWGKTSLALSIDGIRTKKQYPSIILKGEIASIEYNHYNYKHILLDGEYKEGGFNGKIELNDKNGIFTLNGSFNTVSPIPTFNFTAGIEHFRPHELKLTSKYQDVDISVRIKANFTGGNIEDMNGEINIDSLQYQTPEKLLFLRNFNITATQQDLGYKTLTLRSNFMQANIEGYYSYRTMPASVLNIIHRYLPALIPAKTQTEETKNNFSFDIQLYNTDLLSEISGVPLKIYINSKLKGYFNDKMHKLRIEGYFPRFRYGNKFFESAMLLCENPDDRFHAQVRFSNRRPEGSINISAKAQAQNNQLTTTLDWGNNTIATYSGKLSTETQFIMHLSDSLLNHQTHQPIKTVIKVNSTNVILNDTLWEIHPSQIVIDSGKIHIHNFLFSHKDRHLHINGIVSDQPKDTLQVDLQKINIGYVFDIADLGVNFQGEASGPAYASSLLKEPVMYTDLNIHQLGLNNGLLGDAQIHGEWHHKVKGIYLNAQIHEKDTAFTHVYGYIYPLKPTSALDLQINAQNTNLKFIQYYMRSITPEFEGRVTGPVHFYGKFKALTMEGNVTANASMKIDILNTTFMIQDSIQILPEGLTFHNNRIFDTQGHEGRVSGQLRYQHFKNLSYLFSFNMHNMLIMNTQESTDYPFYGTIYATGNASIAGNAQEGVNIDVAITPNRNSSFTYIKDFVSTATNNQFIQFTDKTPRRVMTDSIYFSYFELAQQELTQKNNETDIRLNLQIDATPDATIRIIMDPIAGDYITCKGTGNIRTDFYNKGDVKMFGTYQIDQGLYKFSLQEVIRKDFNIKEGSSITFNGNPLNATLNISASYMVNSASLNDLIANASNYVDQTNVKVECLMNLTGQLTAPNIKLGLDLPNERDEVKALVRNYIPTDEQMNTQILYLLSIGKFYTPDNAGVSQNSDMMSSILSSTISGQLNNALSNIINSNNWNLGTNFSTGESGWTDVEFETMLSAQLLNNRLIINGNFGYRDNPTANTNFVGDFEAEWLVNPSGNIRLKAYNESNDRYYTKTNLTTQGIGIIFRKDFNKWKELFFWTNLLRKRKKNN